MSLRDEALKAMANGRWYGRQTLQRSIEEIEQESGARNITEDEAASLDGLLEWLSKKWQRAWGDDHLPLTDRLGSELIDLLRERDE